MPGVSEGNVRQENSNILNSVNERCNETHWGNMAKRNKFQLETAKQSADSKIKWRGETLELAVDLMGECVIGLVDSGANSSLLSRRWFEKFLKGRVELRRDVSTIFDMNGNAIDILGHIIIDVCVQGLLVRNCVFYIKEAVVGTQGLGKITKQDCLLGMNVLTAIFHEWGIYKYLNSSSRKVGGNIDSNLDFCMRIVEHNLRLWSMNDLGYALCCNRQNRMVRKNSRKMIRIFVEKLKDVPKEYILLEDIAIGRNLLAFY